ncbi:ATP-dependent nuclease [Novosphingobium terrae]|uniref:ATP-dependent nuclease n=1 Tax=Novosphingobium terrae TaxID=2726189 RepID=UPI001980F8A8|nr:AAA family ATPase [Novosphingobium terrae]
MHIERLTIKNFRGLEKISFDAGRGLNVIAGPNAVGKTTILEAIRLCKSLLAQRYSGEAQQVLVSLGAVQNGGVATNAPFALLANDPTKPINIQMIIKLEQDEIDRLKTSVEPLSMMVLQTQLARSINDSATDLTSFLSTPQGQAQLQSAKSAVNEIVKKISISNEYNMDLSLETESGIAKGADINSQIFINFLERSLTPNLTNFNYFTADRALPSGEVAIQLGSGDIQQQIMSHLAQPAVKWGRLKQLIIQNLLLSESGREKLSQEFNLIFDELLPGKKLSGVSFSEQGVLRVLVEEKSSGKIFDIDSMSSGEKGLILTFLTLRLSSNKNTIVMLDEPELHLNAAVCSRITRFMKDRCVEEKGLQLFVCSHSPEIVRDAFEDEKSKLFHLRTSTDITPIYQQDSKEVFEVLNRLGASTSDLLFSRGSVFVEGDHDAIILQAGYADSLQGFKVQPLGGRSEIEKDIPKLQEQEKNGNLTKKQLFIFDRDRNISDLKSSNLVKVYQLERYCIENYLLDEEILFDVISEKSGHPPESRGSFSQQLEEIAIRQLDSHVIASVYNKFEPENAGLRPKEIQLKTIPDAAKILWQRIEKLKDDVTALEETTWVDAFVAECERAHSEFEATWKTDWKKVASGKILIDDLYKEYEIKMSKSEFKKTIISVMSTRKTETWRSINSVLIEYLDK